MIIDFQKKLLYISFDDQQKEGLFLGKRKKNHTTRFYNWKQDRHLLVTSAQIESNL